MPLLVLLYKDQSCKELCKNLGSANFGPTATNPSPHSLDVPGDEVADGGLELGSREVGEQRWPLACGSIPEHHEEEAHHCQTAVLDLTQLHVVPLLQLTKA